jgi:hypothetical protein
MVYELHDHSGRRIELLEPVPHGLTDHQRFIGSLSEWQRFLEADCVPLNSKKLRVV